MAAGCALQTEQPLLSAPSNSQMEFTEKQGQYLAFIYAYSKINGRLPAVADLRDYFRVAGPTAQNMVVRLTQLGLISRTPGTPRSILALVSPEQLPILR